MHSPDVFKMEYMKFILLHQDRPYLMGKTKHERMLARWAMTNKFRILVPVNYLKSYREFMYLNHDHLPSLDSTSPIERCLASWASKTYEDLLKGNLTPRTILRLKNELGTKWFQCLNSK